MVGIQVILKLCMYLFVFLLSCEFSQWTRSTYFYICFIGYMFLDLLYKPVFLTTVPATFLKNSDIKL